MRKLLVIGIGAGNPEYITVQAINALNAVDVFFVMDKGEDKADLIRLREEICHRYITDASYRTVTVADPPRARDAASYSDAVREWHGRRAEIYERLIGEELGDDECGAFLVSGDPSLYDSTLRIIDQVIARGRVAFEYEVIPGISSIQALAARHRIALNRIGQPVHITTGRRLAHDVAADEADMVVMLDGQCAFAEVDAADVDIYWGAYLGTDDEVLVAGKLSDQVDHIQRVRAAARDKKGWIMDTYLLRRRGSGES